MTTEPLPQQNGGEGAATSPAPSPLTTPGADEFVITDAPLPDHTVTEDVDDALSSRGPERTQRLKALAGERPKREKRPPRERKPVAAAPRGGFVKPLTEMYGFIALAIMPLDPQCAMAIMEAAPKAAESLDALAKNNDAVKRVLIMLTQTSAWGAVISAHLPIIIAVSVHHVPAIKNSAFGSLMAGVNSGDTQE